MTRINDHLLVQRVDDEVVIIDESAGEEVAIPATHVPAVLSALQYFTPVPRVTNSITIFEMGVQGALTELEHGDWAQGGNGSMDFGRGVKFACDLIRERIAEVKLGATVVDATIFDELLAESDDVVDVEWPLAPGDG